MSILHEKFGQYTLVDRLAVGGMAEVYLATVHGEAGFEKPVVIKVLHDRYSEDEGLVQMFVDEARLTAQLMHSNICQVHDLGLVNEAFFMAMEFIAGEDLRTLQDYANRQRMAMPVEAAVFIACEALAGMDYAHRKEDSDGAHLNIIHRDISPQNILVSYEGEVKIIDFGIAKAKTRAVQTEAGVIKGKFRYMSPEQASGLQIDHRTDLFAVAVVLYELLTGRPHSIDLPDTEILHRIRKAKFEPLGKKRKVPSKLEKIVNKALSRKPSKRYNTAADFRSDLLDLAQRCKWRFGNSELARLMRKVFDQERRKKRSHSWSGQMVLVNQSRPGTASQPEMVELGEQDMEAWRSPGRGAGPLEDLPTTNLDNMDGEATTAFELSELSEDDLMEIDEEEPTVAVDTGAVPQAPAAPAGFGNSTLPPPTGQAPAPVQAQAQAPAPVQAQAQAPAPVQAQAQAPAPDPAPAEAPPRERTRSVRGGAFSRAAEVKPVKKADVTNMARVQKPGQTVRAPLSSYPVEEEGRREPPPRAAAGSGIRSFLGALVVLGAGAGLLYWLYTSHPALLGLDVTKPKLDSGAPIPAALKRVPDAAPRKPKVRRRKATAKKQQAGLVRIKTTPEGASVLYCGKTIGRKTPTYLTIQPGAKPCSIKLTLAGHEAYELPAPEHSARPITIMATLRPGGTSPAPGPAAAPKPRRGKLRVTSIQAGTVTINGQQVGKTPRLVINLRPGTYNVTVDFPSLGKTSPRRTVKIRAGKVTTLHVEAE